MAVQEPGIAPQPLIAERPKMTYEEFLEWAGEDLHAEWVNGEVIVRMTAKPLHQRALNFLNIPLTLFVQCFDLGEVFIAPMQMKVTPEGAGREPDIMFVAREHSDRVLENRLDGPADLAIEIISDDSVGYDLDDKFFEYQNAGVPEYWIIDPRPRRKRALFYQLDPQGYYQLVTVGADGIYRSACVPGFWIDVKWLWADSAPDALATTLHIIKTREETLRSK